MARRPGAQLREAPAMNRTATRPGPLATVALLRTDEGHSSHWGDGLMFAYGLHRFPAIGRESAYCLSCHENTWECECPPVCSMCEKTALNADDSEPMCFAHMGQRSLIDYVCVALANRLDQITWSAMRSSLFAGLPPLQRPHVPMFTVPAHITQRESGYVHVEFGTDRPDLRVALPFTE